MRIFTIALGDYPHTEPLKTAKLGSPDFTLDFQTVKPVNRAFAPMARERKFDISEMAIATVLQAIAHGVEITLLPVVMAARFQENALFVRADSPLKGPADLKGRRVGVRAYSQTTGLWLRGLLAHEYSVAPSDIAWTTFEGAHVAGVTDPPFVRRAQTGQDLLGLLRAGEIDAAIFGADAPSDPDLRLLFPDPKASGAAFLAKHGFIPINHMVVVKSELASEPGLMALFAEAKPPAIGRAQVGPCVRLAADYAFEQGLTPRLLTDAEIWRLSPL